MHEYLAIGCSHSRAIYMPAAQRWTEAIAKYIGQQFYYRRTCIISTGFVHLQKRTLDLFANRGNMVKWLVIQKPQALRFPWWIPNWETQFSPSRYDKVADIDMVVGRKESKKRYVRLHKEDQKQVVDMIFAAEYKYLLQLREFFTNARIAYYHYWGDYIMDSLSYPELAEINVRLGEKIAEHGVENWEMIVDLKQIPTLYDDEGDIAIDVKELHRLGWVHGDLHPSHVFHDHVLNKVREWVTS